MTVLPSEIYSLILNHLPYQNPSADERIDLVRLCQTSKLLRTLCTPKLFYHLDWRHLQKPEISLALKDAHIAALVQSVSIASEPFAKDDAEYLGLTIRAHTSFQLVQLMALQNVKRLRVVFLHEEDLGYSGITTCYSAQLHPLSRWSGWSTLETFDFTSSIVASTNCDEVVTLWLESMLQLKHLRMGHLGRSDYLLNLSTPASLHTIVIHETEDWTGLKALIGRTSHSLRQLELIGSDDETIYLDEVGELFEAKEMHLDKLALGVATLHVGMGRQALARLFEVSQGCSLLSLDDFLVEGTAIDDLPSIACTAQHTQIRSASEAAHIDAELWTAILLKCWSASARIDIFWGCDSGVPKLGEGPCLDRTRELQRLCPNVRGVISYRGKWVDVQTGEGVKWEEISF